MKVRIVLTAQCSWPDVVRVVRIVVWVLVFITVTAVGGGFLDLPVR